MYMKILFFGIELYMLVLGVVSGLEDGREDWIDPNDMLNYDPSTNTMLKKDKMVFTKQAGVNGDAETKSVHVNTDTAADASKTLPDCENSLPYPDPGPDCPACPTSPPAACPQCKCDAQDAGDKVAIPLLRKYILSILDHVKHELPSAGTQDYVMHISLSASQVTILEKFTKGGDQKHVHDVHEILSGMIGLVASSQLGAIEKTALWTEDKIGLKLDRLVQFVMLFTLASIILLIELKLQIPWRRRVSQLIVLMFVISIPWTWFELYKQAEIKQHTMATKSIPSECSNEGQDVWSTLKSYFTFQDDKCHEYYEHLMIDPLIKVPPTKAIGVTFVRFFVAPLKDVGSAISEFIRALLIDLPLTLYPVAIALVSGFFFMFLFMWFGYSIRLPFFLTIERSPALVTGGNQQLQQAIEENSRQTLAQLEKLQSHLDATEKQLSERLQSLQQVQQAAIEYNCSSQGSYPSPSLPGSRSGVLVAPITPPASPTKHSNIPKLSNNLHKRCSPFKASKTQLGMSEDHIEGQRSIFAPSSRSSPRKQARLVQSCDNLGADGENVDGSERDLSPNEKREDKENTNAASDFVHVETVGCEDCSDHE
ncbi:chloride channel CLIC-like protein 1 isoform X2 [Dreissena polymorpha]|uniref:Chloride channel CLIC-like protein 1 n=1 Tax=Dreissena polymorpha TaxID=45954 RepID=A0A9D4BIE3_DREPO|nr:chloride channel CLIC-like protein 1 isoform X2 [Dreissena polymorpha]KAH3696112.1 hypothetical protein DPMN_083575 [Dreissena polymorpha]